MKLRFFNMIEVLLALAITAVGITGLMGIIPLGLNANRDAMAESFTADIANSYFTSLSLRNATAEYFYRSDGTDCFAEDDIPFPCVGKNGSGVYTNPVTPATWAILPERETGKMEDKNLKQDGVNLEKQTISGKTYFKVRVGRIGAALPDFEADLCGWKCYPDDISGFTASENQKQRDLVRVYLEVSWPVRTAYDKREKRIFVREFYNLKADTTEVAP